VGWATRVEIFYGSTSHGGKSKVARQGNIAFIVGLDVELWFAADTLRSNRASTEYNRLMASTCQDWGRVA